MNWGREFKRRDKKVDRNRSLLREAMRIVSWRVPMARAEKILYPLVL